MKWWSFAGSRMFSLKTSIWRCISSSNLTACFHKVPTCRQKFKQQMQNKQCKQELCACNIASQTSNASKGCAHTRFVFILGGVSSVSKFCQKKEKFIFPSSAPSTPLFTACFCFCFFACACIRNRTCLLCDNGCPESPSSACVQRCSWPKWQLHWSALA